MDGFEGAVLDTGAESMITDASPQDVVVEQPGEISEPQDIGEPEESDRSQDDGTDRAPDGRALPAHIKSALKALADLNPENKKVVQELRKAFYEHGAYRGSFENAAAAQSAKAQLELVGGAEGIAQMQAENAAWQDVDSRFEQGDPVVINDIVKDFPEGFKKIMPHALDQFSSLDPAGFAKALQPHIFAALDTAGLGPVLENIERSLASNNVEAAKDLLGKTAAWLNGQKQMAGQRAAAPDPERQKFETERQKFNEEKEKTFRQDIGRQTVTHQNGEMERELKPYLKTRPNLSNEAKTDLADGINREVNRILSGDQAYQTQVKALLASKTRDNAKIVSYVNAKLSQVVPGAVKAVWSRRYGAFTPAAKVASVKPNVATAQTTQQGAIKIQAKPNRADVDWEKPGAQMLFITNKAYMKSGPMKGKLVSW